MESVGLDMEDIFDTAADLDDDLAMPPPMPDLDDDEEPINRNFDEAEEDGRGEEGTDADVLSKLKDLSKGAAKKKVMRPQPKLDLERLRSNRGLGALPKIFKDVKFKGKGHEADDLGLLMGKLEHWAHRLYPKLPFDDFVERLEKLGAKKPVQTCIKRIRLDMEDFGEDEVVRVGDDENTEEPDEHEGVAAAAAAATPFTDVDAEEAYEEMIREERQMAEKRKQKEKDRELAATPNKSERTTENQDGPPTTPASIEKASTSSTDASKSPGSSQPAKPGGFTADQIARMERNRQLALERRLAKLGKSPGGPKTPSAATGTSPKVSLVNGACAETKDSPSKQSKGAPSSQPEGSQPTVTQTTPKDQGTLDELEAMLDDDEEKSDPKTNTQDNTELSLKLHLPESLSLQSQEPTSEQNAQETRTQSESESGRLELQLTATETVEESSEGAAHASNTEQLDLRLSESEMTVGESASLNLKLSDTEETESTEPSSKDPQRKESDSDERKLLLNLSVSDEEN